MKVKLQHTISRSNNNGWIDYRATSICCNTIYPNTKCNRSAKRIENVMKCLKVNTMIYLEFDFHGNTRYFKFQSQIWI